MNGALTPLFQTRMALPNPWQLLVWAGPFLSIAALWWLVGRTDQIVNYLFPHLEWEQSLGWLNIKAERRAKTALRWVGYGFYLLLAALLYAIVHLADGFPAVADWSQPDVLGDLVLRIPALVVCLGTWLLYLGCGLMPKLRAQREEAELRKFRAQMEEIEREKEMLQPRSRVKMPLQKPRTNAPLASPAPIRTKRRDHPGG